MHQIIEILFLGIVLSADSFSAAIAMGARKHTFKDQFKFAFLSGGAEGIVSLIGVLLGATIISRFDEYDHYIAFALLGAVSLHMMYEGVLDLISNDESPADKKEFHSAFKMIIVAIATSLDAFAVGMTVGISDLPIAPTIISIGIFAFISTIVGMNIAKFVQNKIGSIFNIIAGVVLLLMGIKFLIDGLS